MPEEKSEKETKENEAFDALLRGDDEFKPKKRKKRVKRSTKDYYVDQKEFYGALVNYYADPKGVVTEQLGGMVDKIATGVGYMGNFINYSYKDEMLSDAKLKMVAALNNKTFKLDRGPVAFGYYTQIAINAFKNRIKREKRHHNTVTEYKEHIYEKMALEYGMDTSESSNDDDGSGSYE